MTVTTTNISLVFHLCDTAAVVKGWIPIVQSKRLIAHVFMIYLLLEGVVIIVSCLGFVSSRCKG